MRAKLVAALLIVVLAATTVVAPVSAACPFPVGGRAPAAQSGLSVSGYAFTTSAAAQTALATGNYAGGRWAARSPVVRAYGSVYLAEAGWVVAFVVHQPAKRQVTAPRVRTGFDVLWFGDPLNQDTPPFWW
jgi:hypothetical protein